MNRMKVDVLIYERNIDRSKVASALNICVKTLKRKLNRETPFTWDEACKLQKDFFPEFTKDELFATEEDKAG